MSNAAQQGDRARALHDLLSTQGWQELKAIYGEKRERWSRDLANSLLRPDAEIDQRDIDYHRGYFDAWRQILAQPEQAETRFEKALRKEGTK